MTGRLRMLTAATVLAVAAPTAGTAQEVPPPRADRLRELRTGVIIERVVSAADTARSWALYIPTAYDPSRPWPILFAMDPRGNALLPLRRLVEAAERYGYIVMSSYDSASDVMGPSPNEAALAAMLGDAQALLTLDPRRLYLSGFSGTARESWALGMRMTGNVAGIIGVGAGLPESLGRADLRPLRSYPEFGFYGLAGVRDFNFTEMRRLQRTLSGAGVPNALDHFPGGHGWPPREGLTRALEWMEVRAMASGLRPVDETLADSIEARWMAHAAQLEAQGDTLEALRTYQRTVDALGDVHDPVAARNRATELASLERVQEAQRHVEEVLERSWARQEKLSDVLFKAEFAERAPDPSRLLRDLDVPLLLREAADTTDRAASEAARRNLEQIYGETAYYYSQTFIQRGRPEHAMAMLDMAERIYPDRPLVCYFRARAYVTLDRRRQAVDALRCAMERGLSKDEILEDPTFSELRDLPAYRALIG